VRASVAFRYLLPLLALGVLWRLQPEVVSPFLRGGFAINLGTADQPREIVVPTALLLIAPLALRFGLPLILRAALLLPFAATALSHHMARQGPTFDPARDLTSESSTPDSQKDDAIEKAIAAALAARSTGSTDSGTFAKVGQNAGAIARAPARPFGRHDAAA
jgi:hypothetical protein